MKLIAAEGMRPLLPAQKAIAYHECRRQLHLTICGDGEESRRFDLHRDHPFGLVKAHFFRLSY